MEDPDNPLFQLLKISKKIDATENVLLTDLIAACARLVQISNEEIRCDTFIRPTKKSCTYTILFNRHLNDFKLFIDTIEQLRSLWNRWTHKDKGLTLSDLQIWQGHQPAERIIFDEIWNKVQKHFNIPQPIELVFRDAKEMFDKKESAIEAMKVVLNRYCDKATDYSHGMKLLQDMSEELREKPIRSVEIPQDLKSIEGIIEKLNPFIKSNVWVTYYNRNSVRVEEKAKRRKSKKNKFEKFPNEF